MVSSTLFRRNFCNQQSFDDRPFDHRPFDHRPFDHRPFDHRPFDHRPFDHRPFDHRPLTTALLTTALLTTALLTTALLTTALLTTALLTTALLTTALLTTALLTTALLTTALLTTALLTTALLTTALLTTALLTTAHLRRPEARSCPALTVVVDSFSSSLVACRFLHHNSLTGSLPLQLSELTSLFSLDLSYNKLNGTLPPIFTSSMQFLGFLIPSLSHWDVQGFLLYLIWMFLKNPEKLPVQFGAFTISAHCSLKPPSLEWHMPHFPPSPLPLLPPPATLASISQLLPKTAALQSGHSHPFPSPSPFPSTSTSSPYSLLPLPRHLSHNSFLGPLPSNLATCQSLYELDVSNNYLSGIVAPIISSLTSLQTLAPHEFSPSHTTLQHPHQLFFPRLPLMAHPTPVHRIQLRPTQPNPTPPSPTHFHRSDLSSNYFTGPVPPMSSAPLIQHYSIHTNYFFGSGNILDLAGNSICPNATSSVQTANNCLQYASDTCTSATSTGGNPVTVTEAQRTAADCSAFCSTSFGLVTTPGSNAQCTYGIGLPYPLSSCCLLYPPSLHSSSLPPSISLSSSLHSTSLPPIFILPLVLLPVFPFSSLRSSSLPPSILFLFLPPFFFLFLPPFFFSSSLHSFSLPPSIYFFFLPPFFFSSSLHSFSLPPSILFLFLLPFFFSSSLHSSSLPPPILFLFLPQFFFSSSLHSFSLPPSIFFSLPPSILLLFLPPFFFSSSLHLFFLPPSILLLFLPPFFFSSSLHSFSLPPSILFLFLPPFFFSSSSHSFSLPPSILLLFLLPFFFSSSHNSSSLPPSILFLFLPPFSSLPLS
ncbi:unnamed protein product [Closterium sp. Naga37s-1]|nr:unnamed protein product [Closterium sp. Naga37s-1]